MSTIFSIIYTTFFIIQAMITSNIKKSLSIISYKLLTIHNEYNNNLSKKLLNINNTNIIIT